MVLELPRIKNFIFKQSKIEDIGIGQRKTHEIFYLHIPASEFHVYVGAANYGTSYADNENYLSTTANGTIMGAPVHLPDCAVVTEAIVYVSAAATGTWRLYRVPVDDSITVSPYMATANLDAADNSIVDSVIDNLNNKYAIEAEMTNSLHAIYGARITYQY